MKQALPKTVEGKVAFTDFLLQGIHIYGAETETAVYEASLVSAKEGVNIASLNVGKAKLDLDNARDAKKLAQQDLDKIITTGFSSLKVVFTERWKAEWEPFNMPVGSISKPKLFADKLAFANAYHAYLTEHPDQETPSLGLTAVAVKAAVDKLLPAIGLVQNAKANLKLRIGERGNAVRTLTKALNIVVTVLEKMAPDDPRWRSFGLRLPSDPRTAEIPGGLTVVTGAAQGVTIRWAPSPRADRYRVYVKVKDSPEEPKRVARTNLTEVSIKDLAAGHSYAITVTAVNAAGESGKSEGIIVTV